MYCGKDKSRQPDPLCVDTNVHNYLFLGGMKIIHCQ